MGYGRKPTRGSGSFEAHSQVTRSSESSTVAAKSSAEERFAARPLVAFCTEACWERYVGLASPPLLHAVRSKEKLHHYTILNWGRSPSVGDSVLLLQRTERRLLQNRVIGSRLVGSVILFRAGKSHHEGRVSLLELRLQKTAVDLALGLSGVDASLAQGAS